MWGQDYPHAEGTYPYTTEALRNTFADVPTDEVAAMVGENAARFYGFDLDALAPIAARVGPTVDEIAVRSTRFLTTPTPSPSPAKPPSPGSPQQRTGVNNRRYTTAADAGSGG